MILLVIILVIFIGWMLMIAFLEDEEKTQSGNNQKKERFQTEEVSKESSEKVFAEIEKLLKEQKPKDTLMCGIIENNRFMVLKAIKDGVDVNFELQGNVSSPLNIAIAKGELEIVKELIKAGADVNKIDKFMKTPLSYAIDETNDMRIIQELIKAGADVNGRVMGHYSVLWLAECDHNHKVVEELKKHGATYTEWEMMA